jgi:hypothetical protein
MAEEHRDCDTAVTENRPVLGRRCTVFQKLIAECSANSYVYLTRHHVQFVFTLSYLIVIQFHISYFLIESTIRYWEFCIFNLKIVQHSA